LPPDRDGFRQRSVIATLWLGEYFILRAENLQELHEAIPYLEWCGRNALITVTFLAACGTTQHSLKLEEQYVPHGNSRVAVGSVSNETGQTFDVDVEAMLRDALAERLKAHEIYCEQAQEHDLTLNAKVTEYSKGDAFKRWLLPGYGSTALTVECELVDPAGKVIGTAEAKRTVDAGGGYTIGAWKSVFSNVAHDVVDDLEKQVRR
jgi:hypothetical protein